MPSVTFQISDEVARNIDDVADAMECTRTHILENALNRYLQEEQKWLEDIRAGIAEHDNGEGISHDQAMARLDAHLRRLDNKADR